MIQIIAVVTTAYKSTSPIGFCGGSEQINYFFHNIYSPEVAVLLYTASLSYFVCESVRLLLGAVPRFAISLPIWKKFVKKVSENL